MLICTQCFRQSASPNAYVCYGCVYSDAHETPCSLNMYSNLWKLIIGLCSSQLPYLNPNSQVYGQAHALSEMCLQQEIAAIWAADYTATLQYLLVWAGRQTLCVKAACESRTILMAGVTLSVGCHGYLLFSACMRQLIHSQHRGFSCMCCSREVKFAYNG